MGRGIRINVIDVKVYCTTRQGIVVPQPYQGITRQRRYHAWVWSGSVRYTLLARLAVRFPLSPLLPLGEYHATI